MLTLDTKQIKTLIDNDDKLQWWAAILFAEFYGLFKEYDYQENYELSKKYALFHNKLQEFERLIIQVKLEEISKPKSIIERLTKLEKKVFPKENSNATNS